MRQFLATLLATSTLGGCSLIYNPSDLPGVPIDARIPIDAAPDAEPDAPPVAADPTALRITSVQPAKILEGQGDGGSQPQYLFIEGTDIVDGATVTLSPDPGNTGVDITVGTPLYASDHHSIAVPLTVHVMPTLADTNVSLKVRVEQPGNEKFDEGQYITLHTLPEFAVAGIQTVAPTVTLYSQIKIPAATRYEGTQQVVLRAIADIRVVGNFDVSAPRTVAASTTAATVPGPGGTAGGAGGPNGAGGAGLAAAGSPAMGGGGGGATGGGGGGGGYAMRGGLGSGGTPAAVGGEATGDATGLLLSALDANHGAGGGGGGTTIVSTASGGAGGGGGGTLVLAAGGDLTVGGAVLAKGANGMAAANSTGQGGGGGSGGTILLRAGGLLNVPTRSVAGGAAGDATAGAGSPGRIRVDSQAPSGADRHGLTIVRPDMTAGNLPHIDIQVRGRNGDKFRYYVRKIGVLGALDAGGTINSDNISVAFPVMLKIGLNEICVTNESGTLGVSFEMQDCIQVVNIPIF